MRTVFVAAVAVFMTGAVTAGNGSDKRIAPGNAIDFDAPVPLFADPNVDAGLMPPTTGEISSFVVAQAKQKSGKQKRKKTRSVKRTTCPRGYVLNAAGKCVAGQRGKTSRYYFDCEFKSDGC